MSDERRPRVTRLLAAAALLAVASTYLAARIDFFRRHRPGITAVKYWIPQLTHIWLPGLVFAALLAGAAWALRRR